MIRRLTFVQISLFALLTTGCAISSLSTNTDDEKATTSKKPQPSPMVFVDREKLLKEYTEQTPAANAQASEQEDILQLMRYSRVMHSYPKIKVKDEFKRLAGDMVNDSRIAGKIQMAILLSIPKTSFVNEKQAAQLLTEVVNDTDQQSSAMQEYAYLLLETIQQRMEIQKLHDELSNQLQQERQKRAQLQEQLNALKSIEKSISQRQHSPEANAETNTEAETQ